MIKTWYVSRFKAIRDDAQTLEFKPLTIFAGTNSSGKSTVIQSILLSSQALYQHRPIIPLNGEIISLGTADDVWHRGDLTESIELVGALGNRSGGEVRFELTLVPDNLPGQEPAKATHVIVRDGLYSYELPDYNYWLSIRLEQNESGNRYILSHLSPEAETELQERIASRGEELNALLVDSEVVLERFFPNSIRARVLRLGSQEFERVFLIDPRAADLRAEEREQALADDYAELVNRAIKTLKLPSLPGRKRSNNTQLIAGTYAEWFDTLDPLDKERLKESFIAAFDDMQPEGLRRIRSQGLAKIQNTIHKELTEKLRYLSAYRIAPQALFAIDEVPIWSDVGINGSHIATALKTYGQQSVEFYHPDTLTVERASLIEAVVIWLKHLALVEDIETNDLGKLGTFLNVRVAGLEKELDLTSIGFGTSQVLPIIVQGLLTPQDGIFIIEQPEVHLHARVQSLLAYFFYGLTQTGRQCIVETHSEHIVNFLRALMADPGKGFDDAVQIYFANRDPQHGTFFEPIRMNNGRIVNMPPGFMDESARLAQMILRGQFEHKTKAKDGAS